MKRLVTLALLLLPASVSAQQQEGAVLFDRVVQYEFAEPDAEWWARVKDRIPPAEVSTVLLLFDASASLMLPAPAPEEEKPLTRRDARVQGLAMRLRMGSTSRSDQESLREAYVGYEDGTTAEAREFMGRTFLLTGTQPAYAWKLTGELSQFLGYTVHKATAVHDSSTIEAWFTPEIPVPAGPGLFGGLPGMILVVSVDDGHTVYSATEVKLQALPAGAIRPPTDGQTVSHDEYEEIVAEKLAELQALRRQRRDRRRP